MRLPRIVTTNLAVTRKRFIFLFISSSLFYFFFFFTLYVIRYTIYCFPLHLFPHLLTLYVIRYTVYVIPLHLFPHLLWFIIQMFLISFAKNMFSFFAQYKIEVIFLCRKGCCQNRIQSGITNGSRWQTGMEIGIKR